MRWEDTPAPDPEQARQDQAQAELVRWHATSYLEGAGLQILAQDWKHCGITVHILAREGHVLAVCQVQARDQHPVRTIPWLRAHQLRRAGQAWLGTTSGPFKEIRIDVICVTRNPRGDYVIEHVPGAGR